jgi:hypothetical protein
VPAAPARELNASCRELDAYNVDAVQLTTALDAAQHLGIEGYQASALHV